jgi:hypothetical protein
MIAIPLSIGGAGEIDLSRALACVGIKLAAGTCVLFPVSNRVRWVKEEEFPTILPCHFTERPANIGGTAVNRANMWCHDCI